MPRILVRDILHWRSQALKAAIAIGVAPQGVDYLLRELAQVDRLSLDRRFPHESLDLAVSLDKLDAQWRHHLHSRQPLQQLVGRASWRQWQIQVSPEVLIPRPETEQIIEIVAEIVAHRPALKTGHWVDLGTGSGILACGLADLLPQTSIHGVDCSEAALAIAHHNRQQLGLGDRITFHHGSWWQPLTHLHSQVQGMVANPPYIPTAMIQELEPEVRDHEPHLALDGGEDGLNAIRHLIQTAPDYLLPGGLWLIELMQGQALPVFELLNRHPAYCDPRILSDWSGNQRFVLAFRRE